MKETKAWPWLKSKVANKLFLFPLKTLEITEHFVEFLSYVLTYGTMLFLIVNEGRWAIYLIKFHSDMQMFHVCFRFICQ